MRLASDRSVVSSTPGSITSVITALEPTRISTIDPPSAEMVIWPS